MEFDTVMQKKPTVMIFVGLAICALIGVYLLYTNSLASIKRDADFMKLCLNNGSLQQINDAIKNGANVNARDKDRITPLIYAAIVSDPKIITALISAGADVNAKTNKGTTALMGAVLQKRNPEVITTLLELGADPKVKNGDGKMAIDYARENEKLENTEVLRRLEEASR